MRLISIVGGCLSAVVLLTGCAKQPAATPAAAVALTSTGALPADPADTAWRDAPEYIAKLIPQDMVEPRLLTPSTPEIRVRALATRTEVAFRLEWTDATKNDVAAGAWFSDACAIQVPAKADPSMPAPQMGESGRSVEITYWNAGWQAAVDGRGDTIKDLYPNAAIDHYPFEAASLRKDSPAQKEMAARYAPAHALGNGMAGPRTVPVQDLLAEGPGTLTPAKATTSSGKGRRTTDGWAVVIRRPYPEGRQVAFAVWQGEQQEVGARKMRSAWIPLLKP